VSVSCVSFCRVKSRACFVCVVSCVVVTMCAMCLVVVLLEKGSVFEELAMDKYPCTARHDLGLVSMDNPFGFRRPF